MANVLLLNPRKRKGKKKTAKKRSGKPSPAQLAARRRFAAMSRARARKRRSTRYAPLNRTAARRKASKTLRRSVQPAYPGVKPMARRRSKLKSNPSRRRRRRSHVRKLRRNPVRRLRHNPILPSGFMRTHIKPAAIGAIGALINDVAVGALVSKLPAKLQAPELRDLVRALAAVGLGIGATKLKIASSSMVHDGIVGALTCIGHDAARRQLQKAMPGIPLGEYLSEYVLGENTGGWMRPSGLEQIGMGERLRDEQYMPGASDWYETNCDQDEVIS